MHEKEAAATPSWSLACTRKLMDLTWTTPATSCANLSHTGCPACGRHNDLYRSFPILTDGLPACHHQVPASAGVQRGAAVGEAGSGRPWPRPAAWLAVAAAAAIAAGGRLASAGVMPSMPVASNAMGLLMVKPSACNDPQDVHACPYIAANLAACIVQW